MGNVQVNLMENPGTGQRDHNAVSTYTAGFANPFGMIWGTNSNGAMSIYAEAPTSNPTPTSTPTPTPTQTPQPTASPTPNPTPTWTTEAALPVARADAPAVTYNNMLYFFGGYQNSGSGQTSTVYAYNPSTNAWTQEASMNVATWGSAASVYNGVAYVFGGVDGASDVTVQAYNFATNSWTTKNNLPSNLAGQGEMAVTAGTAIYVFGGWSGTSAYSYNPSTDTYTQLANIPFTTRWGTCAYVNVNGQDRIYIMGGFSATTDDGENAMYYYTPANNQWTYAGTTPYAAYGGLRDDPVMNGSIYFGYGQGQGQFYSNLYSYNPATATWSSALPQGTYPRDGVACGVINYKLYVVGGRNSSANPDIQGLNYNEQFDP
jgi:N-acetylneuraminic acid mutarotase